MDAEDIERVVVAEARFEFCDRKVTGHAGDEADANRAAHGNEPGSGGDGGETGDHARGRAEHTGFPFSQPLYEGPAQPASGPGKVGGGKGAGGQGAAIERAAGIEAEPADPEQSRANEREHDVVRWHRLMRKAAALAEDERADERGGAGADVDDGAAGKVEHGQMTAERPIEVTTFPPDHVRERAVNERQPEHHEQHEGAEFHPLRKGTGDERRRDDGKHHLEKHEGLRGHGGRVVGVWRSADAFQEKVLGEAADEGIPIAEGQAVADDKPEHRHERHEEHALHHGREDVLRAHETAVKEREARPGHHQDEGGADEQPGVVAGVDGWGRVRRLCGDDGEEKQGEGEHFHWRRGGAREERPNAPACVKRVLSGTVGAGARARARARTIESPPRSHAPS